MSQILKARTDDVEAIKEIELSNGLSSWKKEDYLVEIERTDKCFYVAKIGNKTVGFVLARLIITKDSNINNSEIEIYNIAVSKEHRRQMIATKLLNKVIETGFKNSVREIFLEVRKSNQIGQRFYKKKGFEVVGERKGFYTNPLEDALIMSLDLKFI